MLAYHALQALLKNADEPNTIESALETYLNEYVRRF